jgi:tetratricopeptide (TPR) repeat protein
MTPNMQALQALSRDPQDPNRLLAAANAFLASQQFGVAYHLFERLAGMVSHPDVYRGLGATLACLAPLVGSDEWLAASEGVLERGLELYPDSPELLKWMGTVALQFGRLDDAEDFTDRSLALKPDQDDAKHTLAVCKFYRRQWGEGFDLYEQHKPQQTRHLPLDPYAPYWDGTKGKRLLVIGEQGLGDEISFASMVPDAARENDVTLWCDPRLEKLFRRSLPCKVEGKRNIAGQGVISFNSPGAYDYRCLAASLGRHYRRTRSDFPRRAFLMADPDLRKQMRARLDALPGKKVGIAWAGGKPPSYWYRRGLSRDQLSDICAIDGVTWISLQYEQPPMDVLEISGAHHWHDVMGNKDYDYTAALLAELDGVVTVTTAIAHLAGALGKRAHVLVNEIPRWFYGLEGQEHDWYESLVLHRQAEAQWNIGAVKRAIQGAL